MTTDDPLYVSKKMAEILAERDRIRRKSQERINQGKTPFPTVEEVALEQQTKLDRQRRIDWEVAKQLEDLTQ
jgi:hypothetical protein